MLCTVGAYAAASSVRHKDQQPLLSVSSPLKPNIECEAGLTAGSAASATACKMMAINWGRIHLTVGIFWLLGNHQTHAHSHVIEFVYFVLFVPYLFRHLFLNMHYV